MNVDDTKKEILRIRELIKTHKRHLEALELKEAQFGMHVPTYIIIEISDLKDKIQTYERQIETIKRKFGAEIAINRMTYKIDMEKYHKEFIQIGGIIESTGRFIQSIDEILELNLKNVANRLSQSGISLSVISHIEKIIKDILLTRRELKDLEQANRDVENI